MRQAASGAAEGCPRFFGAAAVALPSIRNSYQPALLQDTPILSHAPSRGTSNDVVVSHAGRRGALSRLPRDCGRQLVVARFVWWLMAAHVADGSLLLSPLQADQHVSPQEITVPSELGYIIETRPGATDRATPIIVQIQEVHTDYQAQRRLAGMLDHLVRQYGLKLVLVEGSQGNVSLSYLRQFGPPDNRKQVAEKYLKLGLISGEEYLDIVSDQPLMLWGVERRDLYRKNGEAIFEDEAIRESLKPTLAAIREATEALRPALFSPELLELEAKSVAFEKEETPLVDYADFLTRLANHLSIDMTDYPSVTSLVDIRSLEQGIESQAVQGEQQALMERLNRLATGDMFQHVLAKALEMKAGHVKPLDFYESLQELAVSSGIGVSDGYPALSGYIRYLGLSEELAPNAVSSELDRLSMKTRQALLSSPEERRLAETIEEVGLLEGLLDLRLSPEEYQRMESLSSSGQVASRWSSFLRSQLEQRGLPVPSFDGLAQMDEAIPAMKRFYAVAQARDQVMVDNAMKKLRDTGERIAALITGGFHAAQVTQLLADQGMSVVVAAPYVDGAVDDRHYKAVLRFKNGRGSFEDVQTSAAAYGDVPRVASR